FYSLIRREALQGSPDISSAYLAADWAMIVHILSRGEFARTSEELLVLGREGLSMQPDHIKSMRKKRREYFVPFYIFSAVFLRIIVQTRSLAFPKKAFLEAKIVRFNADVALMVARQAGA